MPCACRLSTITMASSWQMLQNRRKEQLFFLSRDWKEHVNELFIHGLFSELLDSKGQFTIIYQVPGTMRMTMRQPVRKSREPCSFSPHVRVARSEKERRRRDAHETSTNS